jgi:hypothetical protein
MSSRFEPTWDDYVHELDTYAEAGAATVRTAVRRAGQPVRGVADRAGAAAARALAERSSIAPIIDQKLSSAAGLVGLTPAVAAGAVIGASVGHLWNAVRQYPASLLASDVVVGVHGYVNKDAPAPATGQEFVRSVGTVAKWEPLVKQDRALGADDDYGGVTLRLLTLGEGTIRQLVYVGAEVIYEQVLENADDSRRYLERVLQGGHGLTWTSLAVWLRAVEAAVARDDQRVVGWLEERFSSVVVGGSDVMFALKDLRNGLAHDEFTHVSRALNEDVACSLLGAPLASWWRAVPPASLAPVTALLRSRRSA